MQWAQLSLLSLAAGQYQMFVARPRTKASPSVLFKTRKMERTSFVVVFKIVRNLEKCVGESPVMKEVVKILMDFVECEQKLEQYCLFPLSHWRLGHFSMSVYKFHIAFLAEIIYDGKFGLDGQCS